MSEEREERKKEEGEEKNKEEKEKIILPKQLQDEMTKFFFEVALSRKRQEQHETRLSKNNDRSEE